MNYVSFSLAALAKEKGFNNKTPLVYIKSKDTNVYELFERKYVEENLGKTTDFIPAPSPCELHRWIRENYNIYVTTDWVYSKSNQIEYYAIIKGIQRSIDPIHKYTQVRYETYDEAFSSAMKIILKNISSLVQRKTEYTTLMDANKKFQDLELSQNSIERIVNQIRKLIESSDLNDNTKEEVKMLSGKLVKKIEVSLELADDMLSIIKRTQHETDNQ